MHRIKPAGHRHQPGPCRAIRASLDRQRTAKLWHANGRGEQLTAAHLRAAEYWRWRVQVWPQDRTRDLDDLIEARHHLFAAGHVQESDRLTWAVCNLLHDWGAWDREDALIRDTLTQLPPDADGRSNWIRQLADIARDRARVTEATQLYQQALAIDQQQARPTRPTPASSATCRCPTSGSRTWPGTAGILGRQPGSTSRPWPSASGWPRPTPANTDFQRDLSVSYNDSRTWPGMAGTWRGSPALPAGPGHPRAAGPGRPGEHRLPARPVGLLQQARATWPGTAGILARQPGSTSRPWPSARRLARADPTNAGFQRDLSVSYNKLADLARDSGNAGEAARLYQQALAIAEGLARADPTNTAFQRDLSVTYNKLADLARDSGDAGEAARLYQQALAITERLAQADPTNTDYQRDLAVYYDRLADLARDSGDAGEAARLYQQGLAIAERLAQADPENTDTPARPGGLLQSARGPGPGPGEPGGGPALPAGPGHPRAAGPGRPDEHHPPARPVGLLRSARGPGPGQRGCGEAARLYQQALAIRERLARADPTNTGFQRDLSVSYNKLGDLARGSGDAGEAARLYQQALAIAEGLARADPTNTTFQRDLAVSYERLADLAISDARRDDITTGGTDPEGARQIYRRAVEFTERIYGAEHSLTVFFRNRLSGPPENGA